MVELELQDGTTRTGRIVQMEGDRCIIQVFEGTRGCRCRTPPPHPGPSGGDGAVQELLGRVLNGSGRPIDGLGDIYWEKKADINGKPLNPVSRTYPRNYINTGISAIDCLMTLIRGQKLPIFSGSGMQHNKLAAQIVKQANIAAEEGQEFGNRLCRHGRHQTMWPTTSAAALRTPASWTGSSCS